MSKFAWVTLATNDSYSLGALVVANALKRVGTQHQLAVLITPGVTEPMKTRLEEAFDLVQLVDVLDSKDAANLAVLKRPELGITFTKLHCWNLTQFEKCVFLDADVLVLQNSDELFERDEFSAAPDVGWPDCFNSGVFVFVPSVETYGKLIQFADSDGSFDGGDQGLLNQYFSNWSTSDASKRLPFLYNTASTATYSYLPAFKRYNQDIKILHFIGETKPWVQHFDSASKQVQTPPGYNHLQGFLQLWWDLFCEKVHPALTNDMSDVVSDANENEKSNEIDSRTYSPYLIEYHEDTNTFTYNDPWNEVDHENDSLLNDQETREETCSDVELLPPPEVIVEHTPEPPESGIAGALANLSLGSSRSAEQIAYENQFRRSNWEAGQVDYLGQDSFENILKKIQETITTPPVEVAEERERKRSRTPQPEPSPPKEVTPPVSAPVAQAPVKAVKEPQVVEKSAPVVEKVPVAAAKPAVATKDDSPAPTKKKEDRKS